LCHFRERNRLHAKASRLRKKCLTGTLEESLAILKEENRMLREGIFKIIGKSKTNALLEKRNIDSHNRLIQSIIDNRIIDSKTTTFLRGLRKKAGSAASKKKKTQQT
jgi:hypothetical protein